MIDLFGIHFNVIFLFPSFVIVIAFAYLVNITEKQKKARINLQHSLDKLKKAYDELDEQAKIIVKKDLELNKTQEELDKKLNGLYVLHKLSQAISTTFDAEKLFSQIDKSFISELGFSKGLVILSNKAMDDFSLPTVVGYTKEEEKAIKQQLLERGILARTNKPLLIDDSAMLNATQKELLQIFKLSSFCVVPIISQEAKLGLIVAGNDLAYTRVMEADIEMLAILAGQIASGLENARLYEELWHSHQNLEQRVSQRTKELALANDKLKKIDKLKSEFVSAVSHELRTPLTSIKGYASILMAGKLGKVPDPVKQRLAKINKHSDALTKLVNDLLDVARIESGKVKMQLEKIKLSDAIDWVVDIITPQIKDKQIILNVEVPKTISPCLADSIQLGRVLLNLLGNAIKFTPAKGTIVIKAVSQNNFIQVDVHDSGIGIAEKDLIKIFEEFYRVDNEINQQVKGTGLGLPLVKHIIEAHKGKIWAESTAGKGTTFSFILPKA